jgi:tetratricopeptide (TPR) repeat protein
LVIGRQHLDNVSLKANKLTDYESELGRIDREISSLEGIALTAPLDNEKATRLAYRLYQRASLTGSFVELGIAEAALDKAIHQSGHAADLYFLKANLDFKFHRLADVRRSLEMGPGLRDSFQGRALQADLDFQEGRYERAREGYEGVIRDDRTWDNLARLAYLQSKMGDVAGAERLYIEAEDELTAKEMRSYAWVELQRGVLDLTHGRYEEALAHYERADRAYSGYWVVTEHIAELLGAQGRFEEAVALYRSVVAHVPRPELQQALGELCELMGESEQAGRWHAQALAAYLESAERGEVHYYHHLADFYSDVREDGREAVKWARKDVELRENFSTQAALAWALYLDGDFVTALDMMNRALSSGVKDARLFFQLAMIHQAVSGNGEGKQYLELAAEINPYHRSFHVHR